MSLVCLTIPPCSSIECMGYVDDDDDDNGDGDYDECLLIGVYNFFIRQPQWEVVVNNIGGVDLLTSA